MKSLIKIALMSSIILAGCTTTNTTTGTTPNPVVTTNPASGDKVDFTAVKAVITQKCAVCHSATAKDTSFGSPPAGVSFDTNDQIKAKADRINQRAVIDKTMPKNNKTNITQEERDLLGKWFAAGAPIQ